MKKTRNHVPYSQVAKAIREAAGAGNHFAQFLIQSVNHFAKENARHREERVIVSLQQSLTYTKHSKRRGQIERRLKRLREVRKAE